MKTVIAGNGIVALTAALRLAQRGGEVVLIGPAARPGSATLAAAAMLNSFAELDDHSLATDVDRLKFEMSRAATAKWEGLAAELGVPLGRGTDVLGSVDPIVRACVAYGEPHELVDGVLRLPREGWIDPRRVVAALESRLEIVDGVVERLEARGGVVTGAVLGDGRRVEGTHYLVANGASLTPLLAASDLGIAVQRVVYGIGTSVEVRATSRRCLRTANRGVYLAPCGEDRAIIGATNEVSLLPRPADPEAPARLLRAAAEAFGVAGDIVRVNVGWRPISMDTYPLLGATSIPNLAIASGTRRDGFHLAPLLAEHLTALLYDEPTDPRLAVFAPERAPLRTLTRAQAIERAGGDREEVARVHDAAGAHDWGIPPELLPVYRQGR